MKKQLIVLTGESGAGKTTVALEYCTQYDYAMLKEDNFVFSMIPRALAARKTRVKDREIGMKNLVAVTENFCEAGKSVLIEGALVDGPVYLVDLKKLAEKWEYEFVPVRLVAEREQRKKRKKQKNGYVISEKLDKRLRTAAEKLGYSELCTVIDTTDLTAVETVEKLTEVAQG